MKISIITPSYNQAGYLSQTINSVLQQGYANKEYIVVDGGSTDGSVEIIREVQDQLTWWVSENDNGQSDAINKGLQRATGDIIGWINSDDFYEPNIFGFIVNCFKENPEADVIYFDVRNISGNHVEIFHHRPSYSPGLFLTKVCLHQPGVFWRRRIMEKVGYLDESLHYVMDFDFWIRMYLNGRMKYNPGVISNFRIHNHSKTHDDPVELYQEKNRVIARIFKTFKDYPYLEELRKLDLIPPVTKEFTPANNKLSQSDLKSVFIQHVINNAYLSYRMGDFSRTRSLLSYLRRKKYKTPPGMYVLRAKLFLQTIFKSRNKS